MAGLVLWFRIYATWPRWKSALIMAVWCSVWAVVDVFTHHPVSGAFNALMASYWWRVFWKNRPRGDRDKVSKLVGAKAKALKAKLVASMPKASPVGAQVLVTT
jgi:hypothetical protein